MGGGQQASCLALKWSAKDPGTNQRIEPRLHRLDSLGEQEITGFPFGTHSVSSNSDKRGVRDEIERGDSSVQVFGVLREPCADVTGRSPRQPNG